MSSPPSPQAGVTDAPIRVVVVDDDAPVRRSLERLLRAAGMEVTTADDGARAMDLLDRDVFDVVLCDLRMPVVDGAEVLARVRQGDRDVEVVMMTAYADVDTSVELVKGGAYAFLTKPFSSPDAVVIEIENAAQLRRLRRKTVALERELEAGGRSQPMLGSSPAMADMRRLVAGVAASTSTVLVLGESGTGKELVARAIHDRSTRSGKPFVAVNCGAIPKDLVESELFGHTRGAFTSAVHARGGLFEAASGGTLVLDEIGDLPLTAQVKLLRALQLGEIKPVGSDTTKKVDVRVIAATNADLRAAIAAGTFRQDLFYRLNVIAIRVPPLRERGGDIALLAQHFVGRHAENLGRPPPRISREAMDALLSYTWPGNVRELEHAMEHAVVLSPDTDVLPLASLPEEVRTGDRRPRLVTPGEGSSDLAIAVAAIVERGGLDALPYAEAKRVLVAEFNRAYVTSALAKSGGVVTAAARRSGLDRSNFRRLVRLSVDTKDGDGDPD